MIGAREEEVDEPHLSDTCLSELFLTVTGEFEAYPEPKILQPEQLSELVRRLHGSHAAGDYIGTSEAFVRQGASNES